MFKTKTKTSLKRMLSVTLALAMSASMTTVFPVTAEENTLRIYSGDGYEVSYSVKGSWDGNQNIEISLTNTGSESLLNWAVKFDAHGEIGGLWNGTVFDSDFTKYIVKNAGYNYEIQPEQTVTFGYTLSGEELDFPKTIELCSQRTERSGGYNVTMDITDDWDTGFSGTVTVENTGEEPLEAWRLSFDTNFTIDNIWNAQIVSSEGNRYTVVNDVTTTPIGIGERKAFGFTASKQSGVVPAISDFAMSEITINGDFTTVDIPGDEEEDIFVYAFGEYNEDENAIDIEWYSNADDGCEYEVYESVDNTEYTSVIEVSDFTTYRYHIDEDFDTKYFKVKVTSSDKTAESFPFAVNRTDDGYSVDFLDSDSDGLADIYEDIIGTDINSLDTDGDGLTDYQEVYITGTDPTKYDSVTEGVSDADADNDSDGLSNGTEIELGTDPMAPDSDSDGLNDGEEVNVYGTDPLNSDTDGDTLPDGDEPHIGLDPTNPQTFGTPDEEYVTEQTISADSEALAEINTAENPYELTIRYTGTGYAEGNLSAGESGYADAVGSDMVLGVIPEISLGNTCDAEEIVLYYNIAESFVQNELGTYAADNDELFGIKRLGVFTFNEEHHILVPVPTEYDLENNTVSASVDKQGTYFLVDYEKWFEAWGISAGVDAMAVRVMSAVSSADSTNAAKIEKADIIFSVDVSAYSSNNLGETPEQNLARAKNDIRTVAENIFEKGEDVHIGVFGFTGKFTSSKIGYRTYMKDGSDWATNLDELDYLLGQLYIDYFFGGAYIECGIQDAVSPIETEVKQYEYRDDADKYLFEYAPSSDLYIYSNGYLLETLCSYSALYDQLRRTGIRFSYVLDKLGNYEVIEEAASQTGGKTAFYCLDSVTDDITDFIYETAKKTKTEDDEIESRTYISSLSLKPITLTEPLVCGGIAESDSDGLTDWEEVDRDNSLITYELGDIHLPTYEECLRACDGTYCDFNKIMNIMEDRLGIVIEKQLFEKKVLPLDSDPTVEDTDGDGIIDSNDAKPLKRFDSKKYILSNDFNTNVIDIFPKEYLDLYYDLNKIYNTENLDKSNYSKYLHALFLCECMIVGGNTIASGILNGSSFGDTPNASKALKRYLLNDDSLYKYDDFDTTILATKSQKKKYCDDMNDLLELAEETVKPNEHLVFYTNPTDKRKIQYSSSDKNIFETDWYLTIGGGRNGFITDITCENTNGKIQYTASVKYFIFDLYDFFDKDNPTEDMAFLHLCGKARAYLGYGEYCTTIIWDKGDRYPSDVNLNKIEFDNIYDSGLAIVYYKLLSTYSIDMLRFLKDEN